MDRKEAEEKMNQIDPTGTMDERVLEDNPDIRAALLPTSEERVIAVLDEVFQKLKKQHDSIGETPEGIKLTYYDGIRAGLAWAELQITDKMNNISFHWKDE